jgi:DNA-binding transcriptional ArsR family regulator
MIVNDGIVAALADDRRRQLLLDLREQETLHVPELSDSSQEMAGAHESILEEFLSSTMEIPGVDKDTLRTYHVHLPELAESGLVEWDRDANHVTRGPRFDDVKPLLEFLEDHRQERLTVEVVPTIRR